MHFNVIPLPQNEITVLQVLIFMLSLSRAKFPLTPQRLFCGFRASLYTALFPYRTSEKAIFRFYRQFVSSLAKKSPLFSFLIYFYATAVIYINW